jgi:hypothetical protein
MSPETTQKPIEAFDIEEPEADEELDPWPDEIPKQLRQDHLPPIRSGESIFTEEERENEDRPDICFGDLDCYRTDSGKLFGFLLLTRTNSDIYTYVVHNNCYTTFSPDHFDDVPRDTTGNIICSSKRKIYKSVVEPLQS